MRRRYLVYRRNVPLSNSSIRQKSVESSYGPNQFADSRINSEKQAGKPIESLAQRLRRILLVKFPNWQLLVLAVVAGAIWAASLFDWSFVTGRHEFWEFPSGTIARSRLDSATGLVGYFYYVQSSWRLPLFYVTALNTPTGANVIFTDLVPIVAL